MMIRMTAVAAAVALGLLAPGAVPHGTRPPENPVCRPLAHALEHWLPILDRAAPYAIPTGPHSWKPPAHPWGDAIGAIPTPYVFKHSGPWLQNLEGTTSDAIVALGIGPPHMSVADWRAILRRALVGIHRACPSYPLRDAEGPLPR